MRGANPVLPEYLAQSELERDSATLIIDADKQVWNLRTDGQTMWGQGEAPTGALASAEARTLASRFVAAVLAAQSDDSATESLASLGVAAVVVLDPSPQMVTSLDTVPGMRRSTTDGAVQIWNVAGEPDPPTRMALVADGFPTQYLTPLDEVAADSPRMLLLAQAPDPTLRVYVGGDEVFAMDSPDWRAAYALGSTSGAISFDRDIPGLWIVWVQLGVVLLLIIFIFPAIGDDGGLGTASGPRRGLRGAAS